jgi:hypothetical protein
MKVSGMAGLSLKKTMRITRGRSSVELCFCTMADVNATLGLLGWERLLDFVDAVELEASKPERFVIFPAAGCQIDD